MVISYCRKCGAKLDEDARFCRVCGAPVETAPTAQSAPVRRRHRAPFVIPVVILMAVLLVAFLFAFFAFIPLQSVNFSQSDSVPTVPRVNTVILNFDADVADVNVIPTDLPNQLVRIDVSATGSVGLFGSNTQPVKVSFSNETIGDTLIVTAGVSGTEMWPTSFNFKVTCNLYLDRNAVLNVNARTSVGKVTLDSEVPVVFSGLNLRSTTGNVAVSLSDFAVLTQDISVSYVSLTTTTGSVQFTWNNVQVSGKIAVNLATTTGSVTADFTQNGALASNVSVDAKTTTGSANLGMSISGNVGAQVTSHTSLGSISTDMQSFNGDKSSLASSNYPARGNFVVDEQTTTGSIHITATYQGAAEAAVQEQIRDAVMSYIEANHSETAQYTTSLSWTGGRVNTGLLGAEIYAYKSAGWNVNVSYPVIPNPTYTVVAAYSGAVDYGAIVSIDWEGTYRGGTVTETSYGMTMTGTSYVTEPSTQEQARNSVMAYIKANHPETSQLIGDLTWTGGRLDTGLLGAEKYVYETVHGMLGGQWWTVELDYPVIPNPAYTVTVNYTQVGVLRPYQVQWAGTWQNSTVTETAYSSNVPSTQEQIRDAVMVYLENNHNNHNEVAQFLGNLTWIGGRATPTGLVGAETYTYLSGGWNVTITYPVIPNPTYRVTADYSAQGIGIPYRVIWEGTWQNGKITESSFTFAQ
jgi:hypothetical protein